MIRAVRDDQTVTMTGIGLLRITFGGVLAIDAWFKWQPDFRRA